MKGGLNLSKFKKMSENDSSATMIHSDGHTLIISKAHLPSQYKKQLESLPMYAEGTGEVKESDSHSWSNEYPLPGSEPIAPREEIKKEAPIVAEQIEPQAVPQAPQPAVEEQNPVEHKIRAENNALISEAKNSSELERIKGEEKASEVKALENFQKQYNALPSTEQIIQRYSKSNQDLFNAYKSQTINPDRYWNNHSKITAGIGLLLAGAGNSDAAINAISKGIDRDIKAQENEQEKGLNLWKLNRAALDSDIAASLATKNQLLVGLKYELERVAAKSQSAIAFQNKNLADQKIQQMIDANNYKISLMNPTSDNPDPATRITTLVPQHLQQKALDEQTAAKTTVSSAPFIFKAFDDAAKDSRLLTGGIKAFPNALNPFGHTAGQKALITALAPTLIVQEGTSRESAMRALIDSTLPQAFDDDSTVASKREALKNYVLGNADKATANMAGGIDLRKFPSTNTRAIALPGGPGHKAKIIPGAKYEKKIINGKAYMVPVKQ